MLTAHDIVWGIILPAVMALVVVTISHSPPWKRGAIGAPWGSALAIAGGFIVAFTGIAQRPMLKPVQVQGWLVHLAIGAVIVAIIASSRRTRTVIAPILSIALIAAAAWLLQPAARRAVTFAAGIAVAMIIWWTAIDLLARRRPGAGMPALLAAFTACAALVLADSGTQSFAQLAGSIAVCLAVLMIAAWWFRNLSLAHGGVLVVVVLVLGLILLGHLLADVTPRDAIVLAVAPLFLWLGELPIVRRRGSTRFIVAAIAMLAVLSIAVVPALKGLCKTMLEQTESYEY